MPSQLLKNDKISFVVAKPFSSRGNTYSVGDDFPQEEARDIEVFVRARYLIPVVEDLEDKKSIRHWHREIRPKDEVLARLRREVVQLRMPYEPDSDEVVNLTRLTYPETTPSAEEVRSENRVLGPDELEGSPPAVATRENAYDPSYHTVIEVNAYLATASAEEQERVLEAERSGRGRKGIVEA